MFHVQCLLIFKIHSYIDINLIAVIWRSYPAVSLPRKSSTASMPCMPASWHVVMLYQNEV